MNANLQEPAHPQIPKDWKDLLDQVVTVQVMMMAEQAKQKHQ